MGQTARLIVEHKPKVASAGLGGDWEWTGGTIYGNGKPDKKSYTYLASTWATPEIELDGESFDCYVMQSKTGTSIQNGLNQRWQFWTAMVNKTMDLINVRGYEPVRVI